MTQRPQIKGHLYQPLAKNRHRHFAKNHSMTCKIKAQDASCPVCGTAVGRITQSPISVRRTWMVLDVFLFETQSFWRMKDEHFHADVARNSAASGF